MKFKVYEYAKCSTCQNAVKFLEQKKVQFERLPIKDQPPTVTELKKMLGFLQAAGGSIKNLFNTSGIQYRELKMADKLKAGMSDKDALSLLSQNGMLVKRPFLLGDEIGLVGFKAEAWKQAFKK